MSREALNLNPYEERKVMSDGKVVRLSELADYEAKLAAQKREEEEFEAYEKKLAQAKDRNAMLEKNGEDIDKGRRTLLFAAGLALGHMAVESAVSKFGIEEQETKAARPPLSAESKTIAETRETLRLLTPLEQMQELGRVEDLEEGIRAIYTKHHEYLTQNPNGRRDMEIATQNMSKLDMRKLVEPFKKKDIPQQFAYMIAIQETRGRNVTSWAGARGMMGLMMYTVKKLGLSTERIHDPYESGKIAAEYLEAERERFGDNVDMLLHAYNGGAGLFGFTATTQKEERVPENFYAFMEQHINRRYREMLSRGYREHVIEKGDTLMQLSREYKVSLRALFKLNHMNDDSVLHIGEKVKVPFNNSKDEIKELFRKEFEVLHYAPEVKAKYEALKDIGLLARLEAHLPEKTSSFG